MADQSYSKAGGVHFSASPGEVNFGVLNAYGGRLTTGRYGATITSIAVTVTPAAWTSTTDVVFTVYRRPTTHFGTGETAVSTLTVPKDAARGDVYVRRMNVDLPPGAELYAKVTTAASNTSKGQMMIHGYNWPAAASKDGAAKGGVGVGKVYLVEA